MDDIIGGDVLFRFSFTKNKRVLAKKTPRERQRVEKLFEENTEAAGEAMANAAVKKMMQLIGPGTQFYARGVAHSNLHAEKRGSEWVVVEGGKTIANRKMRMGLQPGTTPSKEDIIVWAKKKGLNLYSPTLNKETGEIENQSVYHEIEAYSYKHPKSGKTVNVPKHFRLKRGRHSERDSAVFAIQQKIRASGSYHKRGSWWRFSKKVKGKGWYDYPAHAVEILRKSQFTTIVDRTSEIVLVAVVNYLRGTGSTGMRTVMRTM